MKLKLKQVAAFMCAAAIVIGTAGCGGSGKSKKVNKTGGGELPSLDITGEEVVWLTWNDKSEPENENSWFYQLNEKLKSTYGCSLTFKRTTYSELPTKLATLVMSDQSPDLVQWRFEDNPNYIYRGLVQSYDSYLDLDSDLWKDVKGINDSYAVGGSHYAMVTSAYNNGVIFYNKTMFNDNAVETPWELYKNGQWTWSKMCDIAKQLTQDTDRDGVTDIYGMQIHPLYFFNTCGKDLVTVGDDGLYVNNLRDSVLASAMSSFMSMGSSGSGCRSDDLDGIAEFADNKLAMLWGERYLISSYAEQYKKGTVGIAPTPKMDGADKYYVYGSLDGYWIAKGAKNPGGAAAVAAVDRYLATDETRLENSRNKMKENYGWEDDDFKAYDELQSEDFTVVITDSKGIGEWGKYQWEMWNEVGVYGTSWSSVTEKYYPVLQAEIETANGQIQKYK